MFHAFTSGKLRRSSLQLVSPSSSFSIMNWKMDGILAKLQQREHALMEHKMHPCLDQFCMWAMPPGFQMLSLQISRTVASRNIDYNYMLLIRSIIAVVSYFRAIFDIDAILNGNLHNRSCILHCFLFSIYMGLISYRI